MNPEVDEYFREVREWKRELEALRAIILDFDVVENLKWGSPCYTVAKKNVLILGGFREGCVLSFFQGALLKDPEGLLEPPGKNSRSARVVRFRGIGEIDRLRDVLGSYIAEAIELGKAGRKVEPGHEPGIMIPVELQVKVDENKELAEAFDRLSPGRRRGYCIFFSGAKQAKTRAARVEKYIPKILAGKGLNDCDCGLSARLPRCDGSHKTIR